MSEPISIPQLAEWMSGHILKTFEVFTTAREEDDEYSQAWCRGRIDAYLQLLNIIDKDREAMVRAEWERVVSGRGFASADESA